MNQRIESNHYFTSIQLPTLTLTFYFPIHPAVLNLHHGLRQCVLILFAAYDNPVWDTDPKQHNTFIKLNQPLSPSCQPGTWHRMATPCSISIASLEQCQHLKLSFLLLRFQLSAQLCFGDYLAKKTWSRLNLSCNRRSTLSHSRCFCTLFFFFVVYPCKLSSPFQQGLQITIISFQKRFSNKLFHSLIVESFKFGPALFLILLATGPVSGTLTDCSVGFPALSFKDWVAWATPGGINEPTTWDRSLESEILASIKLPPFLMSADACCFALTGSSFARSNLKRNLSVAHREAWVALPLLSISWLAWIVPGIPQHVSNWRLTEVWKSSIESSGFPQYLIASCSASSWACKQLIQQIRSDFLFWLTQLRPCRCEYCSVEQNMSNLKALHLVPSSGQSVHVGR